MKWYHIVGILGFVLVTTGHALGLLWAPREAMMGDVGRILYAHVPTAWVALVTYLIAFVAAVGALLSGRMGWDATVEASVEVGVVLNTLLAVQGALWAKPTWGVYWSWDPRLTTTAVMVIAFIGVLLLRKLIDQPQTRLTASAVATIIAFVNVPIVYFSVKWWNSLHQNFSSPDTVSDPMVIALRTAAFGMLFLTIGFIGARQRIALVTLEKQRAPTLPPRAEALNLEEA